MARKDISTLWDRDMRIAIDENFKELYSEYTQAGLDAEEARNKALEAVSTSDLAKQLAEQANLTSEQVRNEMNNIIREQTSGGDVVPEVVSARGEKATLGERLNSTDQQLAQNASDLSSREINVLYPPPPFNPIHADNINDDAPLINSIINYLSENGGGTVYIPSVRCYQATEIIMKENVHLRGDKNTIFDAKENNSLTQITTPAPVITSLTQTTAILKGDKTIQINNNISVGDFVELASTDRFTAEWDGGTSIRDSYTIGELMKVESATPTSITFTEPVSFNFPLSSVRFIKTYTPTKNIKITGLKMVRDYSEIGAGRGIHVRYADGFTVDDIRTEHTNSAGIIVTYSRTGTINNISGVGGTKDLGLNYLINLNTATKFVTAKDISGARYRHVVASGATYVIPMNNVFSNIYAEESQSTSIDAHGGTMNFVYENCFIDEGMQISGKGHTIKTVRSKSGGIYVSEGGINLLFDDIKIEKCRTFRSGTSNLKDSTFRNLEIIFGNEINHSGFGNNHSTGLEFENVKLINKITSNADGDSKFNTSNYRGLLMRKGYKIKNVVIEGFPIGIEIFDTNIEIDGLKLINCGWVTGLTLTGSKSVFYIRTNAKDILINDVDVSCTLSQLDISDSRILSFSNGSPGEKSNIAITNIKNGKDHVKDYHLGIVGGTDKTLFIQNVRPSVNVPNGALGVTGKFIYNTVVNDN